MSLRFLLFLIVASSWSSCTRSSSVKTLPDTDLAFLTSSDFDKQVRHFETRTLGTLPEVLEAGVMLNPQLRALAFRILARRSLADQGLTFDPPMISFFSMGLAAKWSVMVSQKIPWPSKLRQELQSRKAQVQVASAELAIVRNVLLKSVKVKYFELYEIGRNLERMNRKLEIQKKMLSLLRATWPTSGGGGTELVLMDAAIVQTDNEILLLEASRTRTLEDLNVLLGRRSGAIVVSGELPWKLRTDRDTLLRKALVNAPEIGKLRAELQVREASSRGVRLKYVPDLQVSAGWGGASDPAMGGATSPEASIMLGLSIRIPDWHSNISHQLKALQYEQDAIRAGIGAVELKLGSELRNLLTRYDALQAVRCRVADSILPRTRKVIETMMISWSAGADNLQKLLQLVDLEVQLEAQVDNGLAQMATVLAMIEEMTGDTVSEADSVGASCQK
ncbi:TolC family protein [Myxococcota bacterium]|nr:TolC family protein [Myxococcota bacterium]